MIRPTRGYCLIEPLDVEEKSAGGVYMPERAQDLPTRGKILAVGLPQLLQDGQMLKTEFGIGDVVIYKKFVDNKVKREGKEYLLVPFADILAIEEP